MHQMFVQLFHKGKHHCTNDLQFDWFGFNQTSKYVEFAESKQKLSENSFICQYLRSCQLKVAQNFYSIGLCRNSVVYKIRINSFITDTTKEKFIHRKHKK